MKPVQIDQKYGVFDTSIDFESNIVSNDLMSKSSILALEKTIDPETYIIGPGDKFGINIDTMEKMFFCISWSRR